MNQESKMVRGLKSLLVSLLILNGFLLFAYHDPANSYFPSHDFLDHMFVLYKLRGENPQFFDYSAGLTGVLGGIPLSALGISDLSFDSNMYVLFSAPIAAVLNEFISRNIGFLGMYFFLRKLIPSFRNKYVLIAPSLLFALLPYYPNFNFTIALLPAIAYVVLASYSEHLNPLRISLIFLAALFGNFTYGGFAVLSFVLMFSIIQMVRRELKSSLRLFLIGIVLALGYVIGISRILFLKFSTNYNSHRLSWKPLTENWFDLDFFPKFISEFISISLRGFYHFPSGQSTFTQFFIPGTPLILLVIYFGFLTFFFARESVMSIYQHKQLVLVNYLIASILLINIFHSAEASGLTHFENLMQEPFQFKRVAILLPFLWCLVLAVVSNSLLQDFPRIGFLAFGLVIAQILVSNFGVQQQLFKYVGVTSNHLTINEYFDPQAYSGLARKLGRNPSQIRVLSFDLDPMIASLNGYNSLDGYVYNYPLEYKNAFRNVIAGELAADSSLREYYDGWGSRVYLFHRDIPVNQLDIDWCVAKDLGAEYVLSRADLSTVSNLTLSMKYLKLSAYKISNCM
jgi:hypothetical protein